MANSYISAYFHCVFSVKERRNLITSTLRERLWPFVGGIARENKMKALAVGGCADHLHVLLSIPATLPVSKAVQLIKGGSSKWIHETFSEHRLFGWQEGYGAFSVSVSQIDRVILYINSQEQHHQNKSFQDEFRALLSKHGLEFDERFVWG